MQSGKQKPCVAGAISKTILVVPDQVTSTFSGRGRKGSGSWAKEHKF